MHALLSRVHHRRGGRQKGSHQNATTPRCLLGLRLRLLHDLLGQRLELLACDIFGLLCELRPHPGPLLLEAPLEGIESSHLEEGGAALLSSSASGFAGRKTFGKAAAVGGGPGGGALSKVPSRTARSLLGVADFRDHHK